MKVSRIAQFKAGSATLVLGLALLATPAFAQDAPAEEDAENTDIIVTGSLITNPNLEQSTPVNVTTADEIELLQSNVAEEILREIPGIVPSIGSAVNNGNGGASFVNLRGLGANRNLVLLDGIRIVSAGLGGGVDLNNIPLAMIERVDSLTGAAVTTYGADAITGVVNFITKRDFTGVEIAAGTALTEQGDGNTFRIDATIGASFDDGRGNVVLSLGYQEADPVYQGDRPFSDNTLDSYSNTFFGSGTSVPSRFSGTRPLIAGTNTPNTNPLVANGGLRQINAAGQAVATFQFFNFNPFNIFQTPFERFNMFAQGNYEISDAVEIYARGMFSKNTVDTIIAPSGIFGSTITTNLNNPFLPATLRNQFCAFNIAPAGSGLYTPRFTPAECAAAATATGRTDPNYREVLTTVNRRSVEVGSRNSNYQTTMFDYRIGARGGITDAIDWDVSGSYGESENVETILGYVNTARARQAALVNGTLANPVCQVTTAGCAPLNLFGALGTISPEAAAFIETPAQTTVRNSAASVRGVVSGDLGVTSPWAGEGIGFALGGGYSVFDAQRNSDLLAATPGGLGGAGGAALNLDGSYDVYDAFGEIIAPLVEDRPFFHSLTLEVGARYSAYSVDAPGNPSSNATTWKVGGSWEPTEDIKIRGNYSRAVRAPNIAELFFPQTVGLTNLGIDPCAGAAPVGNANLRAICLAQGAPAGTIGSITNPTAAQALITVGGNVNLQPEIADTWTLGVVLQPSMIPNFSISIDYYNIKITDVIGTATPGDIIGACFDNITAASAASFACTSTRRNPITGGLDGDPSLSDGLFGPTTNLGALATDGVDLIANYRRDLGFADLALSFVGNWTNSSTFNSNPANPNSINRECVGFYSANCSFTGSIQPKLQFTQRTTLSFEGVDVSLLWRWIDSVSYEPAQFADELAAAIDAGVGDCPDPNGADGGGCIIDPQFRTIPAEHYFDLTTRFTLGDNVTLTLSVQNLLNNQPHVVGSSVGSTSFNSGNIFPSTYDSLGRRFAASVRLRF